MYQSFIIEAEKKYRKQLTEECRRLFSEVVIPSHDHLHHERVWENAAGLLSMLYKAKMIADPLMSDKTIIASFFHDTGLTVTLGVDHGAESRKICSKFLETCTLNENDRKEILDAVEKHDDKSYPAMSDPASLASVISVADDMDAFGMQGIARYIEIYRLRGITDHNMPEMIIANVSSRFRHLELTYGMLFPDLVRDQQKRAATVIDYFKEKHYEKD